MAGPWPVGDPTGTDTSGQHCCVQCNANQGNSCWSTYLQRQTDWRLPAHSSHKAIPLWAISSQGYGDLQVVPGARRLRSH